MWTTDSLQNESDVEQKFLYPFIVEAAPLGLAVPPSAVQTKTNTRRFSIGKGTEQKLYYPDYLVVTLGYPLLVVEAKSPSESVEEGYREARLYATELNALYQHGIAPAHFVMACNGVDLWYGSADHALPLGKVACASLGPYSADIATLIANASWERLHAHAVALAKRVRPAELFKPRRLLGGVGFQNEEVGVNSFGATLTTLISPVFNPSTSQERAAVARNAYVPSKRRERYVDPIDRVIRAARPPSEVHSAELEDSSRPTELLGKLSEPKSLEHKVLLLIGSVGSGKSTFIDHLIEVALPREIVDATVWCRINMNSAPVSSEEIYKWLRREIIAGCRASIPGEDFDDLAVLQRLLHSEITRFKKGVGKLHDRDPTVYSIKLAEFIQALQGDDDTVAKAHVRFTCAERRKLFMVVLDNCDKKTRDEQLLMFEAAQWLQKEFRCLVILPLRDETYDNHRDQPPLDTALKDLVFRIEPPPFQQVLIKRMQFSLKTLGATGNETLSFTLPNGFRVEYPKSDQAFYLTSIVKSLFEHDLFARRMIVGLAGRNMRRALEIFLEFCNSGHIREDQIFRIRQSEGDFTLPFHVVATVLLRMNRRFYDSDHSYIKNIFGASRDDVVPAYFSRYMILQWLRINFRSAGTSGLRGYYSKQQIKHALMPYGLDPALIDREFNYLLAAQCVIAEHLRLDSVDDADLVRLGPAGFVHLDLVGNGNYLAAVAEDTWFSDRLQAERIVEGIKSIESQLHINTVAANARELLAFLESARARLVPPKGPFMDGPIVEKLSDLHDAREAVARIEKAQAIDPWFSAGKRLTRGSAHNVTIQNVVEYGYFCEFDDGLVGLVHKSELGGLSPGIGDRVQVEILWVDSIQKKIGLKLRQVIEEDFGDTVAGTYQHNLGL
jgi:Type I restriction enzyme R protein N terminus (HSDR_N)